MSSRPSNSGILIIGQQLENENAYFNGDIQQLMIMSSPEHAYEVCTNFMPGCDSPLLKRYYGFDGTGESHGYGESGGSSSGSISGGGGGSGHISGGIGSSSGYDYYYNGSSSSSSSSSSSHV